MASPFRRILAIVTLCFATAAPFTHAADQRVPKAKRRAAPARPVLVVPNVQGQVYVFAKGILEDAGFAWHVTGGTALPRTGLSLNHRSRGPAFVTPALRS
jgi:hypothetical protein